MKTIDKFILGSRSPRRRELLGHLVPSQKISIIPPQDSAEAGFDGLHDWAGIEQRLRQIARTKCDDVIHQLAAGPDSANWLVITADTTIVGEGDQHQRVVLGQPPEDDSYAATLREWFRVYYAGRTHVAATAFCVTPKHGPTVERLVKSRVSFHDDAERWLDWYLSTGEPRGKAGGYALQGAGSLFVSQVEGSLSNVIGLPLRELSEVFDELEIQWE